MVQTIQGLRSDAEFERIWKEVEDEAVKFELTYPVKPRIRRVPQRLEQTDCPSPGVIFSPRDRFRNDYFEVLDLLLNELERRFDQEGTYYFTFIIIFI